MSTGRVFRRSTVPDPPVAVEAYGSTIRDADGREYLDAAGGAIVVNVGHGRREIAAAMADQAGRLAYAHGSVFTSEPLEAYAREVARHLPVDDPAIYPVSGGSEAIETALKLARAYHLSRGEPERWIVYARWGSYHGNTLGALDLSGRKPLRRPYEGWLGRFRHVSAAYPYRADMPGADALGTADELAAELDRAFAAAGPGTVAAFVAEPIVGATLAAAVPPDGYWPAIAEVCRRHGVVLIADEVMTGFGRTGRWFALDHWGVRPDTAPTSEANTTTTPTPASTKKIVNILPRAVGGEVAIPDRGERDDREVQRVERTPALDQRVEDRSRRQQTEQRDAECRGAFVANDAWPPSR